MNYDLQSVRSTIMHQLQPYDYSWIAFTVICQSWPAWIIKHILTVLNRLLILTTNHEPSINRQPWTILYDQAQSTIVYDN